MALIGVVANSELACMSNMPHTDVHWVWRNSIPKWNITLTWFVTLDLLTPLDLSLLEVALHMHTNGKSNIWCIMKDFSWLVTLLFWVDQLLKFDKYELSRLTTLWLLTPLDSWLFLVFITRLLNDLWLVGARLWWIFIIFVVTCDLSCVVWCWLVMNLNLVVQQSLTDLGLLTPLLTLLQLWY